MKRVAAQLGPGADLLTKLLPGYTGGRLSLSPDRLRLGDHEFDFEHSSARAFSVINGRCVLSCAGIHPKLFGALIHRGRNPKFSFEGYGVGVWPRFTTSDLAWFHERWNYRMDHMREITLAGRVWKQMKVPGGSLSVISFWPRRVDASNKDLALICRALALVGTIAVEFADSDVGLVCYRDRSTLRTE
jgi:hypothetical protein